MQSKNLFNTQELSSRLAQHVVNSTQSSTWSENLLSENIFDASEINKFSEKELALEQRTLLITQFRTMNVEQLLSAMQQHGLPWRIDMDTDYSVAAVAY
ncbi:MAG: hypothetical protein KAG53_00540 [Endozoicomonadaceae bacterium]|nr:hypothetical protein [Endozoicomonadaceae bacterium]